MTIDTTVPVAAKASFSTQDIINLEPEYSAYVHPLNCGRPHVLTNSHNYHPLPVYVGRQ